MFSLYEKSCFRICLLVRLGEFRVVAVRIWAVCGVACLSFFFCQEDIKLQMLCPAVPPKCRPTLRVSIVRLEDTNLPCILFNCAFFGMAVPTLEATDRTSLCHLYRKKI
jgi:hypothetical protein